MQVYFLEDDISVFGFHVQTFPNGIGEAFDVLVSAVPEGLNRSYYGLSHMDANNKVVYIASVEEKESGEGRKRNFKNYVIRKGNYMYVVVTDWMKKVDSMKDIFHVMMNDPRADLTTPCVEWYKSDEEMWCMLKTTEV